MVESQLQQKHQKIVSLSKNRCGSPLLDVIEERAEEMVTGMENIKVQLREPSAKRIVREKAKIH